MSVFQDVVNDLQGLYSDLKLDESGKTARKQVTLSLDLVLYDDRDPKDWEAVDKKTKEPTVITEVTGAPKLIILEFVNVFNEFMKEATKKDPIANLKEGGFEISDVPVGTTEEHVNKSEDASEEEQNRINREKNKRKLEMAEEAKEAEDTLKEQHSATPKHETVKPTPENDVIFTDRPVEYIDAPSPKNGEVNLFDALSKICKNDLMQIFGNTGTGKTSICTKLALDSKLKGRSVLYIDTEHNINDDQIEAMRKAGIKYEYIKKFPKLCEEVKRLPKYGVVIIDSAGAPALAAYCKSELRGQGDILKKLIAMSDDLKNYATDNNSLVVVINQPESSMNKGDAILEPFGEKSRYYYKEILKTNYAKNGRTTGKTTLVLRAHRSRCMGIDTNICTMEVTDNGVKVIQ